MKDKDNKKYRIVWHEENKSGVPEHVIGMSNVSFDCKESAFEHIMCEIGEDQNKAMYERKCFNCDFGVGDDVFKTESDSQICYYAIVECCE